MLNKKVSFLLVAILATGVCYAQQKDVSKISADTAIKQKDTPKINADSAAQSKGLSTIITADSLAGGAWKDIFTSFFNLAVKDLTGPQKAVTLNTNPYAIMLKHNDSLAKYKYYKKYSYLRRLNISAGAGLDSSYRFNGLSLGLSYALVNNRDYTINKRFLVDALKEPGTVELFKLNRVLNAARSVVAPAQRDSFRVEYEKFINDSSFTLSKMDTNFKKILLKAAKSFPALKKLLSDPNFSLYKYKNLAYDSLKTIYANKALWTLGASDTSYSDGYLLKNVQIVSEYLKGFLNPLNTYNLQLDLKATLNFLDDTLRTGRNIGRQVFIFEPGVNLTLTGKNSKQSWLEFKLSGSHSNIWKGLYNKETQIVNTINGTLRIMVFNNIWIPITIKYDPKSGNVFGFLNVSANFTSLGNLLKPSKQKGS